MERVDRQIKSFFLSGRKKNEDKLVDKICDKYVGIDREKARSYVKQVRQVNTIFFFLNKGLSILLLRGFCAHIS